MSFNVGEKNSKYVVVSDITMKYAYSEKVLFADLRTSRKTDEVKVDKETGEVLTDENGNPIPKREYTHWQGRFVGNAFEPAKSLANGTAIDIVNGWIEKEDYIGKDDKKHTNVYVVISDFTLSEQVNDGISENSEV